jgi:hypothetical protein
MYLQNFIKVWNPLHLFFQETGKGIPKPYFIAGGVPPG